MDDVAAIAPAVAAGQVPEGGEDILTLAALPGCGAAPVLIDGDQDGQGNDKEPDQGGDLLGVGDKDQRGNDDRTDDRFPHGASQRLDRGVAPGRERRHAHQEQQRGEQGRGGPLIERRTHGHLFTGEELGNERIDHAPETDHQDAHEQQVVEQEQRLAGEQ